MFTVTVTFVIKPEYVDDFTLVMKQQALNSLRLEAGCLQFDVCCDSKDRRRFFLYEVYENSEAFNVHLQTSHFLAFDERVRDWVESKAAEQWERLEMEI